MVNQSTSARVFETKKFLKLDLSFLTAIYLNKCLRRIKPKHTCAPISELPYNVNTMLRMRTQIGLHGLFWLYQPFFVPRRYKVIQTILLTSIYGVT